MPKKQLELLFSLDRETFTYKSVDRFEACLHGFAHRLSWNNSWSFQLNSLTHIALNRTFSIYWITKSVNNSTQNSITNGYINNCSCSFDNISFLDISEHSKRRRLEWIWTSSRRAGNYTFTYLSLPRMTIPTLSVSRLRAIPLTPDLNSTISPAWTLVRPNTLAIPSPMDMTDPNSFKSFWKKIVG